MLHEFWPDSDDAICSSSHVHGSSRLPRHRNRGPVNVPLVEPLINGLPSRCLVDTGASHNIISAAEAKRILGPAKFKLLLQPCRDGLGPQFSGVNSVVSALGSVELSVQVGRVPYAIVSRSEKFWVLPSSPPVPVILGGPFLMRHRLSIDYSRRVLSWNTGRGRRWCKFHLRAVPTVYRHRPFHLRLQRSLSVPPVSACLARCAATGFQQAGLNIAADCDSSAQIPDKVVGFSRPAGLALNGEVMVAQGFSLLDCGLTTLLVLNPGIDDLFLAAGTVLGEWSLDVDDFQGVVEIDLDSDFSQPGHDVSSVAAAASCDDPPSSATDSLVPKRTDPPDPGVSGTVPMEVDPSVEPPAVEPSSHYVESTLDDVHLTDEGLPDDLKLDLSEMNITAEQLDQLKVLLREKSAAFTRRYGHPGRVKGYEACINTGDAAPLSFPPRRLSPKERDYIVKTVREMLKVGVIEPASSPWSAAVVLVPKKDGRLRFAIDYRRLNSVTHGDAYALPRVDDTLAALDGCNYFSSFDLDSGFWNIPVKGSDREKTAFNTPIGQYQWLRMPFGLKNAPGIFQRFMDLVLAGIKWQYALVFIDDILVFSKTWEDHLAHLRVVLQRVIDFGLRLKGKKCLLCRNEVLYLGHVVSPAGIAPNPDKVKAIRDFDFPITTPALRRFLGMVGHYRKFIPKFSIRAAPLHRLLRKHCPIPSEVPADCLEAFEFLRTSLCTAPVLSHPDFNHTFEVHTDASQVGLSAALVQKIDGQERTICYLSRRTVGAECSYHAHDLETLAVVWAIESLRPYLVGRHFLVRTDRSAVKWVMSHPNGGRQIKWVMRLQGYDFTVESRPGSQNKVCDAMSRAPSAVPPNFSAPVEVLMPVGDGVPDSDPSDDLVDFSAMSSAEYLDLFRSRQLVDSACRRTRAALADPNSYVARHHLFTELNGILYRTAPSTSNPCLVVPRSLVRSVLFQVHALPMTGHLSARRTLGLLRQRFWWSSITKDTRRFIRACLPCAYRKRTRPWRAGLARANVHRVPWSRVYMDLTGPFELSSRGNTFVLVMMCGFLKWPIVVCLPNKSGSVIARAIYEHLVCVHGVPDEIHSDKAPELIAGAVKEMCQRWHLSQIYTSGDQPQANGQVERFMRTFKVLLTIYVAEFHEDWEDCCAPLVFSYRVSLNDVTGYSPYFKLFGRDPRLPVDMLLGFTADAEVDDRSHVAKLQRTLQRVYNDVRQRQARTAKRLYQEQRDRRERRYPQVYSDGDAVLLWEPQHWQRRQNRPPKLAYRWTGPWVVTKGNRGIPNCNTARIWHARRQLDQVVNVNRLDPFTPWDSLPSVPITKPLGRKPDDFSDRALLAVGGFCIIRLHVTPDQPLPWCVALVLSIRADDTLVVHWYGNSANQLMHAHLPGWHDPADGMVYYRSARLRSSHTAYTNMTPEYEMVVSVESCYAAGFRLTSSNRVPHAVLEHLTNAVDVEWGLPQYVTPSFEA